MSGPKWGTAVPCPVHEAPPLSVEVGMHLCTWPCSAFCSHSKSAHSRLFFAQWPLAMPRGCYSLCPTMSCTCRLNFWSGGCHQFICYVMCHCSCVAIVIVVAWEDIPVAFQQCTKLYMLCRVKLSCSYLYWKRHTLVSIFSSLNTVQHAIPHPFHQTPPPLLDRSSVTWTPQLPWPWILVLWPSHRYS